MTMDVAGFPGAPALSKCKWRRKGARQSKQRYNNNNDIHKVVKVQGQGFKPTDLQKRRRFKRRSVPRSVPSAPFNDSSFLMQVRKAGGLESQIVALTPSPFVSTLKESFYNDFVNHEDYGYGSMAGLIRLRPDDGSSGGSAVDDDVDDNRRVELSSVLSVEEVEQRLDRGVSRFEMTHPLPRELDELRVARQESHINFLEDENLVLKDRLFSMQQEISELKQRLKVDQNCDVDVSDESDNSIRR
jgi:hypothetical protein